MTERMRARDALDAYEFIGGIVGPDYSPSEDYAGAAIALMARTIREDFLAGNAGGVVAGWRGDLRRMYEAWLIVHLLLLDESTLDRLWRAERHHADETLKQESGSQQADYARRRKVDAVFESLGKADVTAKKWTNEARHKHLIAICDNQDQGDLKAAAVMFRELCWTFESWTNSHVNIVVLHSILESRDNDAAELLAESRLRTAVDLLVHSLRTWGTHRGYSSNVMSRIPGLSERLFG